MNATKRQPRPTARPALQQAPLLTWLDAVVKTVNEQHARDRYQPLTLPAIFAAAKIFAPALSLGQFHDGLRQLHDSGLIRLEPWTRALSGIPDRRNAIFTDGEVMYFASKGDRS